MIDVANQIGNLLTKYLPYTELSTIGYEFSATNVDIAASKITLTFSQNDYTTIKCIMAKNANSIFTTSGFYTKNNIISFVPYNGGIGDYYAMQAKFERGCNLKVGDEITLKGFTDTQYNITFKVINKINENTFTLYALEDIDILQVFSGLGYYPFQYTEGFNDIISLIDEGSNQFSFQVDEDSYYYVNSSSKLDLKENIKIFHYLDTIKVIDAATFQENLEQSDNLEYLIIDTTSLVGSPLRSQIQTSDSDYYSTNRNGSFDQNFTINLKYLLQRNADDSNNQTSSGSDIVDKQMKMHQVLTSILRTPLEGDSKLRFSAITISQGSVEERISNGKVIINYQLGFVANYFNDIMITNNIKSYPINQIKINNDLLNF